MKILFSFFFVSFYALCGFAGTDIQNGGGGLSVNGTVATFFSAKIKIDPDPIEGLDEIQMLNQEIYKLKIDSQTKFSILQNIAPSISRKYFRATDQNSKETLDKIKEEYQKATGLDLKDITLFAITNTQTQQTLLLPDFFLLKPIEKMAILFHESMWLSANVKSLKEMLRLEYAFQQYLEENSANSIFEFYSLLEKIYHNRTWGLNAVITKEVELYKKTNPAAPVLSQIISRESILILSKLYLSYYTDFFGSPQDHAYAFASSLIIAPTKNESFKYSYIALLNYTTGNVNVLPQCLISDDIKNLILSHDEEKALTVLNSRLQQSKRLQSTLAGFNINDDTNTPILKCGYQYQ
ncbi:hypothetical protein SHI21_16895 [Bacteriovorax sp. PP10]|uniref:Uncharacterized protein n=1 Tax=Bacteriovorax antarcticus TaxID=3088717 RepID=A0ABU5VXX7_9BACT|nr:hypothetical protein [Bacteriovorax sp. PP10]MEA9357911.1 hypothetical protein [Bacteriovorax sp. PP10]